MILILMQLNYQTKLICSSLLIGEVVRNLYSAISGTNLSALSLLVPMASLGTISLYSFIKWPSDPYRCLGLWCLVAEMSQSPYYLCVSLLWIGSSRPVPGPVGSEQSQSHCQSQLNTCHIQSLCHPPCHRCRGLLMCSVLAVQIHSISNRRKVIPCPCLPVHTEKRGKQEIWLQKKRKLENDFSFASIFEKIFSP